MHLTSFIGRSGDIATVAGLLRSAPERPRLVSLVGAGGCGKTRLAVRVAEHVWVNYPDGTWLVELAPVGDHALVANVLAAALGLHEQPGQPILTTLCRHLRPRPGLLLVLDNCEHLLPAFAQFADGLLRSCPDLQILATSRQPLGIAGETTWRVPSLGIPETQSESAEPLDPASIANDFDAVRLFVERVRAVEPDFVLNAQNVRSAVQICEQLDGIPLAIELAAARVRVLSVEQIARRLDDRFALLTGGGLTAPARHQTLHAMVDWSYDLLPQGERALFRRLAVFAGGFSLEAAEAVDGAASEAGTAGGPGIQRSTPESSSVLDQLTGLVDRSLVQKREVDGEARYFQLETIRQYAWEKLSQANDLASAQTRHFEWCLSYAVHVAGQLGGKRRRYWLDRMESENSNLRAGLEWSKASPDRIDAGLRLAVALVDFWRYRTHSTEGRRHLSDLLAPENSMATERSRAAALKDAGWLAMWQVDLEEADRLLDDSVAIWRRIGDSSGLASTFWIRGAVALWRGNYERSRELLEDDLTVARAIGDEIQESRALFSLGDAARSLGDLDRAEGLLRRSLAIRTALDLEWGAAFPRFELGNVELARGNLTLANAFYRHAFATCHALDDRSAMALAINGLSWIASAHDQPDRAARLGGIAATLREASGTIVAPVHRAADDRSSSHARKLLGEAAYDCACADGKAMALEEAVAYALAEE